MATETPPTTPPETASPSGDRRDKRTVRFAWVASIIAHIILFTLIGGYVIVKGVIPEMPFFTAEGISPTLEEPFFEEPTELVELEMVPDAPSLQEDAAPAASPNDFEGFTPEVIITSVPTSTFSLPTSPGPVSASVSFGGGRISPETGTGEASATQAPRTTARTTFFGTTETTQRALVGRFYDVSRNRQGQPNGIGTPTLAQRATEAFVSGRGRPTALRDFWQSPTPLYARYILIPGGETSDAFQAFGETPTTDNPGYLVHYSGRISLPTDTTLRFNVVGNDWIIVLIDGRPVAIADVPGSADWVNNPTDKRTRQKYGWESPEPLLFYHNPTYNRYTMGDWVEWKAGVPRQIDILIGDTTVSGDFWIFVEEQGRRYREVDATKPHNRHANRGIPILPIFRVDNVRPAREIIESDFLKRIGFENSGPVFNVH